MTKLNVIAQELHEAGGGSRTQSTTGVARLSNNTLVVATQISITPAFINKAAAYGIEKKDIKKTEGAGYHTEVSLYIAYTSRIVTVGASQGFCPDCQKFLKAKGIKKEGTDRDTADQVWHSPEYRSRTEKNPIDAAYPWSFQLIQPENERKVFMTKAEYDAWYNERVNPIGGPSPRRARKKHQPYRPY